MPFACSMSRLELPGFRGRFSAFGLRRGLSPPFVAEGGEIIESGVPAVRVIPALDELEESYPCLSLGAEALPLKQLAF